jgi:hypothetical protein
VFQIEDEGNDMNDWEPDDNDDGDDNEPLGDFGDDYHNGGDLDPVGSMEKNGPIHDLCPLPTIGCTGQLWSDPSEGPIYSRGTAQLRKEKAAQTSSLTLMDPHEVTSGSKAVKKGRPYKIPPPSQPSQLTLNQIKKVKNSFSFYQPYSSVNGAESEEGLKRALKIPSHGLLNQMLAPILKRLKKIDMAKNKVSNKERENKNERERGKESLGRNNDFFLYRDAANAPEDNNLNIDHEDGVGFNGAEGDYSDDGGDAGGFWGNDDDDEGDDNGLEPLVGLTGNKEERSEGIVVEGQSERDGRGKRSSNEEFDPFRDYDEDLARRVEEALKESMNLTQGSSYENICRKHIEHFMQGADQYARYVKN